MKNVNNQMNAYNFNCFINLLKCNKIKIEFLFLSNKELHNRGLRSNCAVNINKKLCDIPKDYIWIVLLLYTYTVQN